MIKQMKRALLFMAAMLTMASAALAQQMPAIPVDQNVRIGKLPNGLTYYIRHNEKPKGQADFYIAQKVGSILEEENQRGLAHFLEHMCFNGTENFPGTSLRDWLETVGVKFGDNLNAYTSIDQTVYNISNVPVARTGVQDSCLLILHDWANALTLDPTEIDKERAVIHEEWRQGNTGEMRQLEKLLPIIYPNNRYGHRLPIGTMEVVDNFPHQALRDYYETWYRPDQQGVIVVGDIDVDYIEGKIKEMFSDIEMPENAKERVYFEVEDTPGTIIAIGADPEITTGEVDIMIKTDAVKPEEKYNLDYMVQQYVESMIRMMFSQRMSDMVQSPDSPFSKVRVIYGNFFLAKTKDMLDVEAEAKGNDVLPAFEAAYRELLRLQRGGFTVGEYERARSEYMSRLERAYNSRETRESEAYVQEYVYNFLDNEPIPSIEEEYQIISQIAPMIPVEAINQALPELITKDNRVIMCMVPENDTYKVPTEADFQAIIAKVDAEEIEPYRDEMKAEPLIPQLPAPGKVVSVTDDALYGAKVLTLSNGAKVYVKPTEYKKDQILFDAEALGGTSAIGEDQAVNLMLLADFMGNHGLGDYTNLDLKKYLQGKQVGVGLALNKYTRSLSGFSTVKDLPTLMELIYMNFLGYNITEEEFQTTQAKLLNDLQNADVDPQYTWLKLVMKSIFASKAQQKPGIDDVNAADRNAILDIIHKSVANAADFTFVFVGDIDLDTFIPLAEQYIATLPATSTQPIGKVEINEAREFTPGKNDITETMKMQTPQTYCFIILDADMPYNTKNTALASVASQILSNRLLKEIREEMGAVYSIGAVGGMMQLGKYNTLIQIPFPMKPELKQEVLDKISGMVNDMAVTVTEEELAPIKEYMLKEATESRENNDGWLGAIAGNLNTGVDTFSDKIDVINALTTQDVMNFMKDFLQQGNYTTVILDPEQ